MTRRRSHSCAKTEPSELQRLPAWAIGHYPSRGGWLLYVQAPIINYGEYLDGLLKQAPADALPPHYGNDALGRLAGSGESQRLPERHQGVF